MEQYIQQLTNYSEDLKNSSLLLQNQEQLFNANANKAYNRTQQLIEENDQLEQAENDIDTKFKVIFFLTFSSCLNNLILMHRYFLK